MDVSRVHAHLLSRGTADVVDEYKATLQEDDEKLPMLKALSVSRAIVLNAGLIAG
jgi:hypothetical protein